MDVNFPSRNAKNRKLNEEQDTSRLGSLPKKILYLILSSLPTKDAVKTSILSKRWRYLWMSIHNLDFEEWDSHGLDLDDYEEDEDEDDETRNRFMNFVERVILLRDASNIKKFSLSCNVMFDACRVNSWVFSAVRRNVEELNLKLHNFEEPFVLPRCLFSCESLRVLKVKMAHDLKLPSAICLSNLKALNLKDVKFPNGPTTQQLFSNCPLLENLYLIDCNWGNVKAVCIPGLRLKKVFISDKTNDLIGDRVDQGNEADDQNADHEDGNDQDGGNEADDQDANHGDGNNQDGGNEADDQDADHEDGDQDADHGDGNDQDGGNEADDQDADHEDGNDQDADHEDGNDQDGGVEADDQDADHQDGDDQDGSAVDQNNSNGNQEGAIVDQNDLNCCQVVIFGKSLQHFDYMGDLINDFSLFNLSPLVSASLYACKRSREAAFRAHKLLHELASAKSLLIRPVTFEVLSYAEEFYPHLPVFHNLNHLRIMFEPSDFASGALLNILQNSPNLNQLEFGSGIRLSTDREKYDWILDPVPLCFLTHLKLIQIWTFHGTEEELHVIKVLLKTATVLERMFFQFSGVMNEKEIHDQLLGFPRGSISCEIDVV